MVSKMKVARIAKDLTQQEVADRTRSHQTRISRIERGARPYPEEAKVLADLLGIPEEELFGDGDAE